MRFSTPGAKIVSSSPLRIDDVLYRVTEDNEKTLDRFDIAQFYKKLLCIFRKPALKNGNQHQLRFTDMISSLPYTQNENGLNRNKQFLDMKPWYFHVLDIEKIHKNKNDAIKTFNYC